MALVGGMKRSKHATLCFKSLEDGVEFGRQSKQDSNTVLRVALKLRMLSPLLRSKGDTFQFAQNRRNLVEHRLVPTIHLLNLALNMQNFEPSLAAKRKP